MIGRDRAPIRRCSVVVMSAVVCALTSPVAAETNAPATEQWQSTDKSMAEFVEDGYELVSVLAPSSQTRTYFLRKPRKLVKCREEAALDGPLPALPPAALTSGQRTALLAGGSPELPKMRIDISCAELVRPLR